MPDKMELRIGERQDLIGWLFDYADNLFEQATWCGSDEDAQSLREDAREVIRFRQRLEMQS